MGPAASQVAIKQLGSNGGGFFGANSAHPFENPTPISNALELIAILLLPAALPIAFGRLAGRPRHGVALFAAMAVLFLAGLAGALYFEAQGNPALSGLPFIEGVETRFGIGASTLWAVATTVTSNGSVNAMHSSLSPMAGGIAMLNMMLGEVAFGGVGSGLYGMVLFVILAVFIAGLMVGRTPEYFGKRIEAAEIKLAVIGVLAPSVTILLFSALACLTVPGLASLSSKGPHGLSEIIYAFSSVAGNNGSAFAGLNADTPFYDGLMSLGMLIGRFAVMVPVLAIAGRLAAKKQTPPSSGTFPTEGGLFVALLVGTIAMVGALTFFPALSLGPIVEHLAMLSGRVF
jgi:K+-transporting ATPase ATPase A chain